MGRFMTGIMRLFLFFITVFFLLVHLIRQRTHSLCSLCSTCLLSNQSKIRRTLGSLAFYRVRHRIRYQPVLPPPGQEAEGGGNVSATKGGSALSASECNGGPDVSQGAVRFCLLRDLGEGIQEWNMEAVIGSSRDTAEPVEVLTDTPGCETLYRYRVWVSSSEVKKVDRDKACNVCFVCVLLVS